MDVEESNGSVPAPTAEMEAVMYDLNALMLKDECVFELIDPS